MAKTPIIGEEQAKKVLAEENKKKVDACTKEVQGVLDKHGCMINVGMVVTVAGNRPVIEIIPKPERG